MNKGGSIGVHRSLRHSEEKTYVINQNIIETLYNNNLPVIKKKKSMFMWQQNTYMVAYVIIVMKK